jgi:hypothetical protein
MLRHCFEWRRHFLRRFLISSLLSLSVPVYSKGTSIESVAPFGPGTWAQFCAHGPRPALVVFTAQTCAVCPEVIAVVQRMLRARRATVVQAVVFMDAVPAPGGPKARMFRPFTRQFLAQGSELAVRHSVNPAWRGELPYLAMVDARGLVRYGAGAPAPEVVDAWLAPAPGLVPGAPGP